MRLRTPALLAAVFAAVLVASPAYAQTSVTLTPTTVTIGPDGPVTQTIHVGEPAGQEVIVRIEYDPPVPGLTAASITRGNGTCHASGTEFRCSGFRDVVVTYPALSLAEATTYHVVVKAETTEGDALDRTSGWVNVQAAPAPTTQPPPPTTAPPTSPATIAAAAAQPPATTTAPPPTTTEPETPTTTPALPGSEVAEPGGQSGLPVEVFAWGGTVLGIGAAAGMVALFGLRRRQDG